MEKKTLKSYTLSFSLKPISNFVSCMGFLSLIFVLKQNTSFFSSDLFKWFPREQVESLGNRLTILLQRGSHLIEHTLLYFFNTNFELSAKMTSF